VLQPRAPLSAEAIAAYQGEECAPPEEERSDFGAGIRVDSYYRTMVRELPATFVEFYDLRANTFDLNLASAENCEVVRILRVPMKITITSLREFVAKVEDCRADVLLFRNRPRSRMPDVRPLVTVPGDSHFTHVYFVTDGSASALAKAVLVEFSETAFRRTARRLFYAEVPRDFAAIRREAEKWVKGKQHRVIHIRDCAIHAVVAADGDLRDFRPESDRIRFEIPPTDQCGTPEQELVRVTRVVVQKDRRLQRKGFPFFLRIDSAATLETVREQIKVALQMSDDVLTHYRFMVRRAAEVTAVFKAEDVLKKDAVVGREIDPAVDTLVVVVPADEGSFSGNRHEAVKIHT
jgi:hypothetical protein